MSKDTAQKLLRGSGFFFDEEEDEVKGLVFNANDTWAWATAWGEPVPDEEVEEVARLFGSYGYCGLLYWMSERNGKMRSEFEDVNRFVDFVANEERIRREEPDYNRRAFKKAIYTLGAPS